MQDRSYVSNQPETFPNFLLDFFEDGQSTELEMFINDVPALYIFKVEKGAVETNIPLPLNPTTVKTIIKRIAGIDADGAVETVDLVVGYLFSNLAVFYPLTDNSLLFTVNNEYCLLVDTPASQKIRMLLEVQD